MYSTEDNSGLRPPLDYQIDYLLSNDDPETLKQDVEVAQLLAEQTPAELWETAQVHLVNLDPKNQADLFAAMAERLNPFQLLGVSLGLLNIGNQENSRPPKQLLVGTLQDRSDTDGLDQFKRPISLDHAGALLERGASIKRLASMNVGGGPRPQSPKTLPDFDVLGPLTEFHRAVGQRTPPHVREQYALLMSAQPVPLNPWEVGPVVPQRQPSGDPAVDAAAELLEKRLTPATQDSPRQVYRVIDERDPDGQYTNAKTLAQPLINSAYRNFSGKVQIAGETHLANLISMTNNQKVAVDIKPSEAAEKSRSTDLFAANLTEPQRDKRKTLVDNIFSFAGSKPTVSFIPFVYFIDANRDMGGGTFQASLVRVENKSGEVRFYDPDGQHYSDLAAFQSGNKLPQRGSLMVMASDPESPVLVHGTQNVSLWATDARKENWFESARNTANPYILPTMVVAGAVSLAVGVGWLGAAATVVLAVNGPALATGVGIAADGALALATGYGAASASYDLVSRYQYGGEWNPVKDHTVALEVGTLALSIAGFGAITTKGAGTTLKVLSAQAKAESSVFARGTAESVALRHEAAQYLSWSRPPLRLGEKLYTPVVNKTIFAGGAAMLTPAAIDLYRNWDHTPTEQLVGRLTMFGSDAIGLALSGHAAFQQTAAARALPRPPIKPVETPPHTPPSTAPHTPPGKSAAKPPPLPAPRGNVAPPLNFTFEPGNRGSSGGLLIDGTDLTRGSVGYRKVGPAADPRMSVVYEVGSLPDNVTAALTDRIQQAGAADDVTLADLRTKRVAVLTQGRPGGPQEIIAYRFLAPDEAWKDFTDSNTWRSTWNELSEPSPQPRGSDPLDPLAFPTSSAASSTTAPARPVEPHPSLKLTAVQADPKDIATATLELKAKPIRCFDGSVPDSVLPVPTVKRESTWFEAGDLPEGLRDGYADFIHQKEPWRDVEEIKAELVTQRVALVTEKINDNLMQIVGGATIEIDVKGDRSWGFSKVHRDAADMKLLSGDARVVNLVGVKGGAAHAAQAAFEGVVSNTGVKRLVFSASDLADQQLLDGFKLDPVKDQPSVMSRTASQVQQDAPDRLRAIPVEQRTEGQKAALAKPTRREQLKAIAELTELPDHARMNGYAVPIDRKPTLFEKIIHLSNPKSFLGFGNEKGGLYQWTIKGYKALDAKLSFPYVIRKVPGLNGGPERISKVYPEGKMPLALRLEQAERIIEANQGLPGNAYAADTTEELAATLHKSNVIRTYEIVGGKEVLFGGATITKTEDGKFELTQVFGPKEGQAGGGGAQSTEAAFAVTARLRGTLTDLYTRWPGAMKLYDRMGLPVVAAKFTREAPELLLGVSEKTLAEMPVPMREAYQQMLKRTDLTPLQKREVLREQLKVIVQNTPKNERKYNVSPELLLGATRQEIAQLPNQLRIAYDEVMKLPPEQRHASLGRALRNLDKLDFQTSFHMSQQLHASIVTRDNRSFVPDAAKRLLQADVSAIDGLPPALRDAVVEALQLPPDQQEARLAAMLEKMSPDPMRVVEVDMDVIMSLPNDQARKILDTLPKNAVHVEWGIADLPMADQPAALQAKLAELRAGVPMLQQPPGVLRLDYAQPGIAGPNFAVRWSQDAWKAAYKNPTFKLTADYTGMGLKAVGKAVDYFVIHPLHIASKPVTDYVDSALVQPAIRDIEAIRGKPFKPVEIMTFAGPVRADEGFRAELNPADSAPLKLRLLHAVNLMAEDGGHANNPYARMTKEAVAEQLNKELLVTVYNAAGEAVGGGLLTPEWKGPANDNRWRDGPLPKHTALLSHDWGSQRVALQVEQAARVAAEKMLVSENLASHHRWPTSQPANNNIVDASFVPLAPDMLLAAGPATRSKLPQAFKDALTHADTLPSAERRAHLVEWMATQDPADYVALMPPGVLDVSYNVKLDPTSSHYRDQFQNVIKPGLSSLSKGFDRLNEEFNPYGGDKNIQATPDRQLLRDIGHVGMQRLGEAATVGKWSLLGLGTLALTTGDYEVRKGDTRTTDPFNVSHNSSVISIYFPLMKTMVSAWYTPPAYRGMAYFNSPWVKENVPMGEYVSLIGYNSVPESYRAGAPIGNPLGPQSATGVLANRGNLSEIGWGYQVGDNHKGYRSTMALRLVNAVGNIRADKGISSSAPFLALGAVTSLTSFFLSQTSTVYYGGWGVQHRDLQLTLGPSATLNVGPTSVVTKLGGNVVPSIGLWVTRNVVEGKEEPFKLKSHLLDSFWDVYEDDVPPAPQGEW